MSTASAAKPSNKKVRKRNFSGSKNSNRGAVGGQTWTERDLVDAAQLPKSIVEEQAEKDSTLNDPAIVAAGQPRRQPLRKKNSTGNMAMPKGDSKGVSDKGAPTQIPGPGKNSVVPRAPRAMRRGRQSNHPPAKAPLKVASGEEDESVVCAPKTPQRKEKVPTAATPPRLQVNKSRRERTGSQSTKANESVDSEPGHGQIDDKARCVHFQTESRPALGSGESIEERLPIRNDGSQQETERMGAVSDTLAQQKTLNEAAALLAHTAFNGFPHSSVYPNFSLAQQQLASAQVIAQLRASVEGFRTLKNFTTESAPSHDAGRVLCLTEDTNTTTNIYVNNLPSHTTDDDLLRLGACFGPVKSHKAIINQETGLCKGYGFIMYEYPEDAETAMQQLPLHGLTTSWAKESFSTKLRKLSDNTTSNVYVSNLPQEMTPHQLEQLFAPHLVVSLRILLDDNGISRGVGFVRLRDRDTAQECIDKLHGKILPGQTTPLQARFADSEAQKRLKQSASQANPKQTTSGKPVMSSGLVDSTGLADQMYLASLQGLQNWAGFGTPQNNSVATFPLVSPSMGMTSPGMGYNQWSPNLAVNAAANNWNFLASDMYPLINPGSANFGLNYANYSPSSITTSLSSPFAQFSNKSLSPLSFTSSPLSGTSPVLGKGTEGASRPGSTRSKPTYLPPDVHQQHAKALLEAHAGLAYNSPQAEAFGLSQMLLGDNANEYYQQQMVHNPLYYGSHPCMGIAQHAGEAPSNALGMSGMTPLNTVQGSMSFDKPASVKSTAEPVPLPTPTTGSANPAGISPLAPIRFALSTDPNNPITVEAMEGQDVAVTTQTNEAKQPTRVSTPMPSSVTQPDKGSLAMSSGVQVHDAVAEEGDSLVIESGAGSTVVGSFSSAQQPVAPKEVNGISKSDSGKSFVCEAKTTDKTQKTVTDACQLNPTLPSDKKDAVHEGWA